MDTIYKNTISVEDYQALRATVKWEKLVEEQAREGLKGSAYIVSCYNNEKIVGCARILWDRGYYALLADVIVRPEYQHRGIGSNMVHRAIMFMKSQCRKGWKIKMILMSAKGKEEFYKKHGFHERPDAYKGSGMEIEIM